MTSPQESQIAATFPDGKLSCNKEKRILVNALKLPSSPCLILVRHGLHFGVKVRGQPRSYGLSPVKMGGAEQGKSQGNEVGAGHHGKSERMHLSLHPKISRALCSTLEITHL